MYDESRGHTCETLIWTGTDHKNATVCLFTPERDHILARHDTPMGNNFTAIYDSVEAPDEVFESGSVDNREVFFKASSCATYYPGLITKTVVEYNPERTEGFIVTAMPVKKVGGNVGVRTYPESNVRQE